MADASSTEKKFLDFTGLIKVFTTIKDWAEKTFLKKADTNSFATKEDLDKYQIKGNYLTEHQSLDGYATEKWVEDKKYLTEHQSLGNYYNKSEVDTRISNAKSEIIGGAGADYDTLKEIETWVKEHQELYNALISTISGKADKSELPTALSDDEIEDAFEIAMA